MDVLYAGSPIAVVICPNPPKIPVDKSGELCYNNIRI
jgi:hypothetical protein